MACMDFSFDSRIRKKYVPLINQQRYLRHVKRIAARNLFIPLPILRSKLLSSKQKIDQNILDQLNNDNDNELDEPQLYSSLNISFYFTIHHPLIGDLLYRSEYIANNNPSWKVFDGSSLCSPSISQFIVRVYFVMMNSEQSNGKKSVSDDNDNVESGTLFLEWKVNLTGLLYIGEEFPHDRRLTRNSIIFGFAEGFYTSVCSVASELLLNHSMPPSESLQIVDHSSTRYSYCLNTLIRIQMVQCIMQATAAQSKIEKLSLEEELKKFRHKQELQSEIEKMKTSIEFLTIIADRRRQRLRELRNEMVTIEEKLNESNMDMSSNVQLLKQELSLLSELRTIRIPESVRKLSQIRSALVHHRRMLARKFFSDIYPIIPFPDNQGYSINCVHLPSDQDMEQHHEMKMISVGLGYVAHLIYYLAFVLDIYLFHQILPMGSHSSLLDLFNRLLQPNDRIVPLYLKSKSSLNVKLFKHGWHLLNRNIVFIRQSMGLISTDLAMTLWNLHSLYLERLAYDNDDHHIEHDNTLNRFNTYSPSIIVNIDHHHLGPLGHSDNAETNNVKILNDINEIKINNIMIDTLWKEVEQMTIQSMKYKPQSKSGKKHSKNSNQLEQQQSSAMMSIVEDEIKDIILKQRQAKRQQNSERLSQLSSSLSFSRAISSFNLLTPESIRSSVISTSSPQDILRHQRRCSVTTMNPSYQLSSSSYGSSGGGGGGNGGSTGSHHSTLSSSSLRLNNQYPPQPSSSSSSLFQQFHSIRRSQNQYNMNHNQMMIHGPRSLPSMMMSNNNNSFLHRSPRINNSQLLEKILNRSSNSRSSSSSTSSSSSSMQSPFNNNHLSISLDNGLNLMEKHNSRHNNNNNNNDHHHHKQQLRQPQELVDNHNNDDDDVDDGNITFLVEDNID